MDCDGRERRSIHILSSPEWHKTLWNSEDVYEHFPEEIGITIPPGECREFRLVPVGDAVTEPQPVPISPLALWIADKSFTLAIECLRIGKPLTADDMAKLVEQTVVASIAAAARIEGGANE